MAGISDRDYIRAVDMIGVGDDSRLVAAMANHMTAMDREDVHRTALFARELRDVTNGSPYISSAPAYSGPRGYSNFVVHNPSLYAPPGYFYPD